MAAKRVGGKLSDCARKAASTVLSSDRDWRASTPKCGSVNVPGFQAARIHVSDLGIAIIGTLVAALVWTEFEAWSPRLCRSIAKLAARRCPASYRNRLEEEWLAHVQSIPGKLTPLLVAVGFLIASTRLNRDVRSSNLTFARVRGTRRLLNFAISFPAIIVLAPLLLGIMIYSKLKRGGPLLYHVQIRLPDGSIGLLSAFNISGNPFVRENFEETSALKLSLSHLAVYWNGCTGKLDLLYVDRLVKQRRARRSKRSN